VRRPDEHSGVIGQDLLLILNNGFLVPENLELVAEQKGQPNLIVQELLLISDDHRLVGDDFLLVLESGLRHCRSSSVRSIFVSSSCCKMGAPVTTVQGQANASGF
jgi:hypothetical protein